MPSAIVMPNLGFDAKEARLVEWKIREGEPVAKGQVIAIVESDKAAVELESIAGGILLEQLCAAGETVPVGTVIARVGDKEKLTPSNPSIDSPGPSPRVAAPAAVSPVAQRLADEHGVDLSMVLGSGPGGRIMRGDVEALIQAAPGEAFDRRRVPRALPKVRRAAKEAGIALAQVRPTGPGGTITLADVRATATREEPVSREVAPFAHAGEGRHEVIVSRMRRAIGKRLSEGKRAAPHFYVGGEFDLDAALKHLAALPAPAPRVNDLIQFLAVQTLRRVPALNAVYENDHLYQYDSVNLAIAVALDEGLITPVLHGVERLSPVEMAAESRALIARARENRLTTRDLQDGTFTISNLGITKQVDHFTAVINPPQVAILAVGALKPRAVVVEGGLFVRQTVHLTLAGDHRVLDGVHLAKFLSVFQEELDTFSRGSDT